MVTRGLRGLAACGVLLCLLACGGGGGGGGGGGSSAAVSLSPARLEVNQETGSTTTLTVRATINDTSAFNGAVFVLIVDPNQVLQTTVNLSQIDARTFSATLFTSPGLAVGRHQGSLRVHLCKDVACNAEHVSAIPLPYDFHVGPVALHATPQQSTQQTIHLGDPTVHELTVDVTGPDIDWSASADVAWLQLTGASGRGAGSFTLRYIADGKAIGSYAGTVTVRATGQSVSLPVTLDVLAAGFALNSGVPTFTAINGSPIAAQSLAFAIDNNVPAPWNAASSKPWLLLDPSSGTTPAALSVRPDPRIGPLASGPHSADVTLTSPGVAPRVLTTQLTLIAPTLSGSATGVTLGGAAGRDMGPKGLTITLNTGSNTHPWTLSALPDWLSATTPGGTVGHAGSTVTFTPRLANVTAGSVSGTVNVNAVVNGDIVTLPLTINLNADQRRLLPARWGVGFAATPLANVLTRTLAIADNYGGALAWNASSDSAWLAVTASGTTGTGGVTMTANPATLPGGAISTARITLSSPVAGVAPAVVRVALWKDSSAPNAVVRLPLDHRELAADRIRPLIYAHDGGTSIDVFNAYTQQKVTTIANVGGALGQMSVSPDGGLLYVLDTAAGQLAVVELDTRTKVGAWALDAAVDTSTSVLATRPNGVEIVFVGHGRAYSGGRSLGTTGIFGSIATSDDDRKLFTQNSGLSPASVAAYDVDYSFMAGGMLLVTPRATGWFVNGSSNGQDIAVAGDGSTVYLASGAPYRCTVARPADFSVIGDLPGGSPYPNNAEVTSDGRVICGVNAASGDPDFWVHSGAGTLIGSGWRIGGGSLKPRQLVVTADGLIVIAQTEAPALAFVPIGPTP